MPRVEQVQEKALDEFRQKNLNSKKRKTQTKSQSINESIVMFVCLFFLFSLVFLQIVKGLTPKIDTSIGNNTIQENQETNEAKMKIDDRLKLIQFNDSTASGEIQNQRENSIFNSSLDEPVVLPSHRRHAQGNEINEQAQNTVNPTTEQKVDKIEKVQKTAPVPQVIKPPVAPLPTIPQEAPATYKVYVGLYETAEQAQTAKSIIKESTLGQNAFVKLTKEGYTLQIGSYSARPQAEAIVQALKVNNFPLARLSEEK